MLQWSRIDNISKYISIPNDLEEYLDRECKKDEDGSREETYSTQIKRLLKIR